MDNTFHAALLQELADVYGFSFDILTADLDERSIGDRAASPEQLVTLLAKAKADALMPQLMGRPAHERPRFLITCDQVVVHKGRILEKPENTDEVSWSSYLSCWPHSAWMSCTMMLCPIRVLQSASVSTSQFTKAGTAQNRRKICIGAAVCQWLLGRTAIHSRLSACPRHHRWRAVHGRGQRNSALQTHLGRHHRAAHTGGHSVLLCRCMAQTYTHQQPSQKLRRITALGKWKLRYYPCL